MALLTENELQSKSGAMASQAQLDLFEQMLRQIDVWMKTGFRPKEKIISLWETTARAISKGKTGKTVFRIWKGLCSPWNVMSMQRVKQRLGLSRVCGLVLLFNKLGCIDL
jgi:hypothetical protein